MNNILNRIYILTLFLSVFQIFILKISGIVLSVYFILTYSLILGLVSRRIRRIDIYSLSYIFLISATFLSILWSPDQYGALRSVFFILSGFIIFSYTRKLAIYNPDIIYRAFKWLCLAISFHSIIVMIFFFNPSVEYGFLGSSLAKLFINNGSLELYKYDFGNNVTDPNKAGGFFLNGNSSAILAEFGLYLTLIINRIRKNRFNTLLVITNFFGIVCTGSKSAIFLALFSFLLAYFSFPIFFEKINILKKQIYLLINILVFCGIYFIISSISSTYLYEDGVVNAERRKVIFQFAYGKFLENPILGLGFGGWDAAFFNYGEGLKVYGLNGSMPAHNYFIISWSNGGAFLLFASILFYFCLIYPVSLIYKHNDKQMAILYLAIGICVLLHTSVDNVLIYEDPHYSGIFAALIAWAVYSKRSQLN